MSIRPSSCLGAAVALVLALAGTRLADADAPPNAKGGNPPPPPLHVIHGYGIKGMALWIDAEHGVTANAQGRVTQLVDRIGNFTLTPPGQGPTVVPKALNGHAVFHFNGNESLYSPYSFGNALDRAMTFIIVSRGTAPAEAQQFQLYLGQNADAHFNRSLCHFKGREMLEGQFVGCYGPPVLRNVFIMDSAALNRRHLQASFYRDGMPMLKSGLNPEDGNVRFEPVSDGVTLGAAPTNLYGWQGDIAEALVFTHELSPAEMQTLWAALSAKYALQNSGTSSTLPAPNTAPAPAH
ncbi:MAG TPA: hypothetical protein VHY09_10930 [Candidatus Methylacidiphilales bacterium]|jgi:hypothetical protein|nr:hypothetical protein [Candidatus Methylacidiphilales bacterium]